MTIRTISEIEAHSVISRNGQYQVIEGDSLHGYGSWNMVRTFTSRVEAEQWADLYDIVDTINADLSEAQS